MSQFQAAYTPREELRLTGKVSMEVLETLLDTQDKLDSLYLLSTYVEEAKCSLLDEGFMDHILDDLHELSESISSHKHDLLAIVNKIGALAYRVRQDSEHVLEQLNGVEKILDQLDS